MKENKLPSYEKMPQNSFEYLVLGIIKTKDNITSEIKAVKRYMEIERNIKSEDCVIDSSTTSLRKGMWEQLIKLDYVAF